jgi:hypothetical protein
MKAKLFWIVPFLIFFSCSSPEAWGDTVWLVVSASGRSVLPLIEKKNSLNRDWPSAIIVASDDCKNARPGFFVLAVEVAKDKSQAEKILFALRKSVPDAYLKRCEVLEKSRLSFGIPLIDPSIQDVPRDVVNWDDTDRITELRNLRDMDFIIVKKVFVPKDDSFREGRRTEIYFFRGDPKKAVLLDKDCWDFGGINYRGSLLTFHCACEVAGDHFIHRSMVYRLQPPEKIFERTYCRNPELLRDNLVRCEEESVDADGELHLKAVEQPLTREGEK